MNAREKATSVVALREAWKEHKGRLSRSCFGADRVTGAAFGSNLERELREIRHRLGSNFTSHGLLAIAKPKASGGDRIICVPTVADRLIQFSLLGQLRPRLAAMGIDNPVSFGIAPGVARSVIGARKFACRARDERPWVYKTDIHKFFDNIDRTVLKAAVDRRVRRSSLLPLLHAFIDAEVADGFDRDWPQRVTRAGIKHGHGVRQGMPLSPFLAGAYLVELDRQVARAGVIAGRYVDDMVAFFASEAECKAFHKVMVSALSDLGLVIGEIGKPGSKTKVYAPEEAAEFLGMEITAPSAGRCKLLASEKVLGGIRTRFEESCSPALLLERKVHLTSMARYFSSLVSGYSNAYHEADNHAELKALLEQQARAAQEAVLRELFGDRLLQLSVTELQFVGVDPAVWHAGPAPTARAGSTRRRSKKSDRRPPW